MKRKSLLLRFGKPTSFTLVELLVVMAIIAILAGVLFSAGSGAIASAKRAKAQNAASQIQTAVINYYTEYSVYPVPANTTIDYTIDDTPGSQANWGSLIEALCGNIKPTNGTVATPTISNTRAIPFLSLRASDVDAGDAPLNPAPFNKATNPYFNIAIDSDYDGVLGAGASTAKLPNFVGTFNAITGGSSTAGVAIWAQGGATNANFYIKTY